MEAKSDTLAYFKENFKLPKSICKYLIKYRSNLNENLLPK